GHVVLVLLRADRLERIELLAVLLRAARRERERGIRPPRLERLEHLLLLGSRGLRELGDRRRATELHGQLLDEPRQLDVQLLQPPRNPDRPALVAEVPLDLADDVRRCVRRQLDTADDVEPVGRLDEPDRADLDEILELLAAVRVAPRERAHERHVLLDQLLARLQVALLVITAEESLVGLAHPASPFMRSTLFVTRTQSPPSRSTSSTESDTASRIRRASRAPPVLCSSTGASSPVRNGPISITATSSPMRARTVTSSARSAQRSRTVSSASVRSSSVSTVRSLRVATPPRTRWATPWNSSSPGSVRAISSTLISIPPARPVWTTQKSATGLRLGGQ